MTSIVHSSQIARLKFVNYAERNLWFFLGIGKKKAHNTDLYSVMRGNSIYFLVAVAVSSVTRSHQWPRVFGAN